MKWVITEREIDNEEPATKKQKIDNQQNEKTTTKRKKKSVNKIKKKVFDGELQRTSSFSESQIHMQHHHCRRRAKEGEEFYALVWIWNYV